MGQRRPWSVRAPLPSATAPPRCRTASIAQPDDRRRSRGQPRAGIAVGRINDPTSRPGEGARFDRSGRGAAEQDRPPCRLGRGPNEPAVAEASGLWTSSIGVGTWGVILCNSCRSRSILPASGSMGMRTTVFTGQQSTGQPYSDFGSGDVGRQVIHWRASGSEWACSNSSRQAPTCSRGRRPTAQHQRQS